MLPVPEAVQAVLVVLAAMADKAQLPSALVAVVAAEAAGRPALAAREPALLPEQLRVAQEELQDPETAQPVALAAMPWRPERHRMVRLAELAPRGVPLTVRALAAAAVAALVQLLAQEMAGPEDFMAAAAARPVAPTERTEREESARKAS